MQSDLKNDPPKITVAEFVERSPADLDIRVLAGENGLSKKMVHSERIQKLGLALAGFAHYIHPGRIQIVGQSEISYLTQLGPAEKIQALGHLDFSKICCILITRDLTPPPELVQLANEYDLPILQTPLVSSKTIGLVSSVLLEELAPQLTFHGVLLSMYGMGVLILGESGIGKSECALDLISQGHRLISDDAVLVKKIGNHVEGESPELTYEHLEIHGLGIINIRDLFGVSSIGQRKKIELCIELKKWGEFEDIERIGLEMGEHDVFGVKIAKFVLPVSPGRNLATLVATAVRVYLLRRGGFDAAQKLVDRHTAMVSGK
jgi:HPr kinase/phosphorylase